MDKDDSIPKDKIAKFSLKEMLGNDKEGLEDYVVIDACVQTMLFTGYPGRRDSAFCTLNDYLPGAIVVSTRDYGLVSAYVYLETVDSYIWVR